MMSPYCHLWTSSRNLSETCKQILRSERCRPFVALVSLVCHPLWNRKCHNQWSDEVKGIQRETERVNRISCHFSSSQFNAQQPPSSKTARSAVHPSACRHLSLWPIFSFFVILFHACCPTCFCFPRWYFLPLHFTASFTSFAVMFFQPLTLSNDTPYNSPSFLSVFLLTVSFSHSATISL